MKLNDWFKSSIHFNLFTHYEYTVSTCSRYTLYIIYSYSWCVSEWEMYNMERRLFDIFTRLIRSLWNPIQLRQIRVLINNIIHWVVQIFDFILNKLCACFYPSDGVGYFTIIVLILFECFYWTVIGFFFKYIISLVGTYRITFILMIYYVVCIFVKIKLIFTHHETRITNKYVLHFPLDNCNKFNHLTEWNIVLIIIFYSKLKRCKSILNKILLYI